MAAPHKAPPPVPMQLALAAPVHMYPPPVAPPKAPPPVPGVNAAPAHPPWGNWVTPVHGARGPQDALWATRPHFGGRCTHFCSRGEWTQFPCCKRCRRTPGHSGLHDCMQHSEHESGNRVWTDEAVIEVDMTIRFVYDEQNHDYIPTRHVFDTLRMTRALYCPPVTDIVTAALGTGRARGQTFYTTLSTDLVVTAQSIRGQIRQLLDRVRGPGNNRAWDVPE